MPAGGGWEVEAGSSESVGTSTTGHGLHLSTRENSQGYKAGKAWKMTPSAARVAGIASAACTRVSTRPNIVFGAECDHG